MAWSVVGRGDLVQQTSGSVTALLPAGMAENDLIVAHTTWRTSAAASPTLPAGSWATAVEVLNSNTATDSTAMTSAGMYYIWRGGSDPFTDFTFTSVNVLQMRVIVYRGGKPGRPPTATNGGQTMATGDTAVSLPGLTTVIDGDLILASFNGAQDAEMDSIDSTDPHIASGVLDPTSDPDAPTWIRRASHKTTTGADCALVIYDALRAMGLPGATGNLFGTASIAARHTILAASFELDHAGAGASDGVATVTGVGSSLVDGAGGASAGVATVSGVGSSVSTGDGAGDNCAGAATVTGVGSSLADAVGASAGVTSGVTGVSAGLHDAVGGPIAGVATVTGVGQAISTDAAGSSDGVATAAAASDAIADMAGASAGVATAAAISELVSDGAGIAAGTSTVTGVITSSEPTIPVHIESEKRVMTTKGESRSVIVKPPNLSSNDDETVELLIAYEFRSMKVA